MKFGEREKKRKNRSDVSANRPGNRRRVKNKRFWYLEVARFLILYTGVKNRTSAIVEGCKMDFFPLGFNYVVNGLMIDCYVGPVGHKRWDFATLWLLDWKLCDGLGPYWVRALVSIMMSDMCSCQGTHICHLCRHFNRWPWIFAYAYARRIVLPTFEAESFLKDIHATMSSLLCRF